MDGTNARGKEEQTGNAGDAVLGASLAACCTWAALNNLNRPRTYVVASQPVLRPQNARDVIVVGAMPLLAIPGGVKGGERAEMERV